MFVLNSTVPSIVREHMLLACMLHVSNFTEIEYVLKVWADKYMSWVIGSIFIITSQGVGSLVYHFFSSFPWQSFLCFWQTTLINMSYREFLHLIGIKA